MQLGVLCGNPVENSEQGVHDALECVFAHGSYANGAKAVMIVSQWMWVDNENQLAVGIKNINRHFADYYELFR